jgi:hypothetical protein
MGMMADQQKAGIKGFGAEGGGELIILHLLKEKSLSCFDRLFDCPCATVS